MRFVSFFAQGKERCGVLVDAGKDGEKIVEIPGRSILELLHTSGAHHEELTRLVRALTGKAPAHAPGDVKLLAPVPHPPSFRDAYAFRAHVETARRNRGLPMIPEYDRFPVFYFSNHHAITGPGPVVVRELHLDRLDYELELAVVIGKGGIDIPASRADEHIFGYTILNDWSARGLQLEEMKLNLGPAKGKDFASSMGPWLVTREELLASGMLRAGPGGERLSAMMRAWVNGRKLSEGDAASMQFTFAQIIERASYGVELRPGDVIGSGTVGSGCLLELNGSGVTKDLWLKAGDRVVLEVEGLGRLENEIALA